LKYERTSLFNNVPTVKWAGIPVPRSWRCGNRGNVASALIEKPARGNFLTVLDCGYSLQYGALTEFREGKGMVLLCQLDVTGRTESDPVAEALVGNMLRYTAEWKPGPTRSVAYSGDEAGLRYLRSAGVEVAGSGDLLVVGPGGQMKSGVRTLAIGFEDKSVMKTQEYIGAHFDPFPHGSVFEGVCPADTHNRDPRVVPLINGGVLADGPVVYSQLAPWQFDYSGGRMNVKRTFRGVARMTSRVLGNLGVSSATPLLANITKPAEEKESRWLHSFYLDEPEEWDDPYRFFRW
jgi:hypothetical protein